MGFTSEEKRKSFVRESENKNLGLLKCLRFIGFVASLISFRLEFAKVSCWGDCLRKLDLEHETPKKCFGSSKIFRSSYLTP